MALTALQSVKASLKEQAPGDNHDTSQSQSELFAFGPGFEETLNKLVEMMQSKIDGLHVRHIGLHPVPESPRKLTMVHFLQALVFSAVKYEHLKQL